jgi:hypothetical protein
MPESTSLTVQIVQRHTVTSSNPESYTSLGPIYRLGPLDQLVLAFIPVAVVYVYPPSTSSTPTIPIEKICRATSLVLDTYPHLTGRLGIDDKHGGSHLHSLGSGCEILEATCQSTLKELAKGKGGRIGLMDLPGKGEDLMAPYDFLNKTVKREEQVVFTIQHTRFACGGVALGIRILHCLNDGAGFFHLVRDLASIYRSLNTESTHTYTPTPLAPAYLANYENEATETEKEEAKSYKPVLYHLEPAPSKTELAAPDIPAPEPATTWAKPNITGQVLHFSTSNLDTLKLQATSSEGYVTTFDALTAYLNQRIYQARSRTYQSNPSMGTLGEADLLCPIDLRSHLNLEKDGSYPYNAVLTTSTSFPQDLLLDNSKLPEIASKVHAMVRPLGPGDAEKTVKWIAAVDRSRIRHGYRGGNGGVMVSQWNKMDMYDGGVFDTRPVLVAPPFTPISLHDGLGYTIPTENGSGIDVYLALREEVWAELDVEVEN